MYRGEEFEDIVVITHGDGTRVLLKDVATVVDAFEDTDTASRFDGKPAALVMVFRVGDEGALQVADAVKSYIERLEPSLPAGVTVSTWDDDSIILRQRIGLLLRNAGIGLILVFLCLALFLDIRLAFWTTMGIPISFLGGLWLLPDVRCVDQHDLALRLYRLPRHCRRRCHRRRGECLRVPAEGHETSGRGDSRRPRDDGAGNVRDPHNGSGVFAPALRLRNDGQDHGPDPAGGDRRVDGVAGGSADHPPGPPR